MTTPTFEFARCRVNKSSGGIPKEFSMAEVGSLRPPSEVAGFAFIITVRFDFEVGIVHDCDTRVWKCPILFLDTSYLKTSSLCLHGCCIYIVS